MIHYEKWIFLADLTDKDAPLFSDPKSDLEKMHYLGNLLFPLELICDHFKAAWKESEILSDKYIRKYSLAHDYFAYGPEPVKIEHEVRLPSRSRSTTVINLSDYEPSKLLWVLHQFYGQNEAYRRQNPDLPAATRVILL